MEKGLEKDMEKSREDDQVRPGAPSFRRLLPKGWETTNAKVTGVAASTNPERATEFGFV
jgi:hypothetical protein